MIKDYEAKHGKTYLSSQCLGRRGRRIVSLGQRVFIAILRSALGLLHHKEPLADFWKSGRAQQWKELLSGGF